MKRYSAETISEHTNGCLVLYADHLEEINHAIMLKDQEVAISDNNSAVLLRRVADLEKEHIEERKINQVLRNENHRLRVDLDAAKHGWIKYG